MNVLRKFNDVIEDWQGTDPAAEWIQQALEPVLAKPSVESVLSGQWLTHAVHPLLVTVPIGAWTASAVFDLQGKEAAARQLVGFGAVAAVPSVATGLSDWVQTDHAERRVGLLHASANAVTLSLYATSYVLRATGRRRAGVVTSLLGAAGMAVSGYLGGHLSYSMGVGVDRESHENAAPFG